MKLAVFAYSRTGCGTARRVLAALPEADAHCYTVARLAEPDFLPLEKQVYAAAFAGADAPGRPAARAGVGKDGELHCVASRNSVVKPGWYRSDRR